MSLVNPDEDDDDEDGEELLFVDDKADNKLPPPLLFLVCFFSIPKLVPTGNSISYLFFLKKKVKKGSIVK